MCTLMTGVQTCALPIYEDELGDEDRIPTPDRVVPCPGAYQARIVFGIARSRSRLRDNGSPVARERQPDLPGRRSGGKDDGHLDDVASQRHARLARAAGLGSLERSARRRACGPHLEQVRSEDHTPALPARTRRL